MKVKDTFVLRQVADTWAVMPLGEEILSFNGMMTMNDSGALLWKCLERETTREALADAFMGEYIVSWEQALKDVDEFVAALKKLGCLEE